MPHAEIWKITIPGTEHKTSDSDALGFKLTTWALKAIPSAQEVLDDLGQTCPPAAHPGAVEVTPEISPAGI